MIVHQYLLFVFRVMIVHQYLWFVFRALKEPSNGHARHQYSRNVAEFE